MSAVRDYFREMTIAIDAAKAAGDAVRDLYDRVAAETYTKSDGSPVTDADLASDRIIRDRLTNAFPGDAILTEEGVDDESRLASGRVWIVDPLDGTQQFVNRTGEFDVLIALVVAGQPVVGVLLQPTTGRYLAAAIGSGAWRGDRAESKPLRFLPAATSRSPRLQTSTWLNYPNSKAELERASLRLGASTPIVSELGVVVRQLLPPDNSVDAFLGLPTRPGHIMAWEWDFAAADIVVREAGGAFTDAWGNRLQYNKPLPRNVGGIVMSVDSLTHQRVLDAIAPELPEAVSS